MSPTLSSLIHVAKSAANVLPGAVCSIRAPRRDCWLMLLTAEPFSQSASWRHAVPSAFREDAAGLSAAQPMIKAAATTAAAIRVRTMVGFRNSRSS
jgi:hypothetical protein